MPRAPKPTPVPEAPAEPLYPTVEGFIEFAGPPEVDGVFASIKEGLDQLKGPGREQGKKVRQALERTEELLNYLLGVRAKMDQHQKKTQR